MIGKICSAIFPYYDIHKFKNSYKKRPVLIIGDKRNNDYTILPVSTITNKENIDKEYDILIEPSIYPKLNLDKLCYIRVHKQTVIYKNEIKFEISSIIENYPELYKEIITKLKEFNKSIIEEE